jgi:hypothetical protein
MNTSAFGVEKATLIRVPAVANLMIDSDDRKSLYQSPFNFQIVKNQPYVTGFFSRIGATEVVLDWCVPNISAISLNTDFEVDASGVTLSCSIPDGTYTVAQAIDQLKFEFETENPAYEMNIITTAGHVELTIERTGVPGVCPLSNLSGGFTVDMDMTINDLTPTSNYLEINCPDLRPYKYIDICSDNLTSVQDARDATTQTQDRNVLVRWYMSWDESPPIDAYGFPILMGYTRFSCRRIYNPPKQIKWEQNLPISNLGFQVYAPDGSLLPDIFSAEVSWRMTLQLSEG